MIAQQREISDSYETRQKIKSMLTDWLNIRQIAKRIGKNERSARRILLRMQELKEVETKFENGKNYYKAK